MEIYLTDESKRSMEEHAINTFPNECCGFFFGTDENGVRTVTRTLRVENSKDGDQRRRFEISRKDYQDAEKIVEESGLTMLGIYHSHPLHPAIPSEHDLKQAVPFLSYIIVSVEENSAKDLKSWQLNDDFLFEEEDVVQLVMSNN